jgi:hypothetical protein
MTLDALEFIRRFLQHVLPAGFQKVRHYGFLRACERIPTQPPRNRRLINSALQSLYEHSIKSQPVSGPPTPTL